MHIGLLIYGSLDTISGGYLYDRQLVQALHAAGHRVSIVALPWRDYARHLRDNWSRSFFRQLCTAPFDLLLQDELNHPSLAWLNGRLRRAVRYPMIAIVHHLRSSEAHPRRYMPLYQWVERRYLHSVDGFLYNSETTRSTVMHLAPNVKPSLIVYPAADHRQPPHSTAIAAQLALRTSSQDPLQILFVGNLIARKGLHQLLAALATIPNAPWQLTVVGSLTTDPVYTARIRQQIDNGGLTARVFLRGSCSDEEVRYFYQQSDLFAAPAYEGFGIAYLEAMSFGLPVIASTAGAAHEIVSHGVNGYLVEPDAIVPLATYMAHLCQGRVQLATMGAAARQRYDRHPTWQESFQPVVCWLEEQTHKA